MAEDQVYDLREMIANETNRFVNTMLRGEWTISDNIRITMNNGMSLGYINPEGCTNYITGTKFVKKTDIEDWAEIYFFDVLSGKISIAKFVEDVYLVAAVWRRELKKQEE